jgi:hypothetical protein
MPCEAAPSTSRLLLFTRVSLGSRGVTLPRRYDNVCASQRERMFVGMMAQGSLSPAGLIG